MNITLSKEAQNLLHLAQENTKQPIETIITKALVNYLEDLEDYKSAQEAERIFSTIAGVVRRNIGEVGLELLGFVPNDKVVMRSIKSRTLFSDDAPNTEPSVCLKDAASKLLYAVEQKMLDTSKEKSFVGFFKRLAEKF